MRYRWFIYYDGACPLCQNAASKLKSLVWNYIKLTFVDLNSDVAKAKGFNNKQVVLETAEGVYFGMKAWLKILEHTKYSWVTHILLRPLFCVFYLIVSKNRKLFSKLFY